jgi:uncharacterized protein YbdZ (MbtH family)
VVLSVVLTVRFDARKALNELTDTLAARLARIARKNGFLALTRYDFSVNMEMDGDGVALVTVTTTAITREDDFRTIMDGLEEEMESNTLQGGSVTVDVGRVTGGDSDSGGDDIFRLVVMSAAGLGALVLLGCIIGVVCGRGARAEKSKPVLNPYASSNHGFDSLAKPRPDSPVIEMDSMKSKHADKTKNSDLPAGWEAVKDDQGYTYYWNIHTNQTTYDHPAPNPLATPSVFSQKVEEKKKPIANVNWTKKRDLPAGWEAVKDDQGDTYYWNTLTDETTYDRPAPMSLPPPRFPRKVPDPAWCPVQDDNGETYYWNETTDETAWDRPMMKP